ncbi:hypothetical protein N656DRAFT_467277 [Canariomyces notabilis]|uniref:Uncharacterized protein n=1 Tax=Canariomyces notabilis TaxID=2074819 RepID=A0AAN6QCW8_9PEZI|nr:hypothetical protein N656DRAFT_467277 [Canariomyces arenarius]
MFQSLPVCAQGSSQCPAGACYSPGARFSVCTSRFLQPRTCSCRSRLRSCDDSRIRLQKKFRFLSRSTAVTNISGRCDRTVSRSNQWHRLK